MEIVRYNVGGSGWGTRDEGNLRAGANVEALLEPESYRRSKASPSLPASSSSSSPPPDPNNSNSTNSTTDWVYDWTRDEPQRRCLLGARQRGANTFEAFANSPPFFMTKSGRASGAGWGCAANLPRDRIDDFARYLVDVVAHYKKAHDLVFTSIAPFNEPREIAWWAGTNQEGCRFKLPDQRRVVRCLAARLKQAGLAPMPSSYSSSSSFDDDEGNKKQSIGVRIAVSDENRIDRALSSLEATLGRRLVVRYRKEDGQPYAKLKGLTAEELALVGHVSTHAYAGLEARLPLRVVVEAAGVDLWMSEVGYGNAPPSAPQSATHIAENIAADVNRMRSSAWVYWQGVEDSDGGSWRGLMKLRPVSSLGLSDAVCPAAKVLLYKTKDRRRFRQEEDPEGEEKERDDEGSCPGGSGKGGVGVQEALVGFVAGLFWCAAKGREKVDNGEGGRRKTQTSSSLIPRDVTSRFKERGLHPAVDPKDALQAGDLVISKQFYGLKQFSKHIRSGSRIGAVPWARADDTVVAFSRDGSKAVCVAINSSSASKKKRKSKKGAAADSSSSAATEYFSPALDGSREVAFDLGPFLEGKGKKTSAKVSVFLTDATRDAEEVESFEIGGGEGGGGGELLLTYSLPALSVATFVVEKRK